MAALPIAPDTAFPKDGGYAIPIKDLVRDAESLQVGDPLTISLEVDP